MNVLLSKGIKVSFCPTQLIVYPISFYLSSLLIEPQFGPGKRCAQLKILTFPARTDRGDGVTQFWSLRCKLKVSSKGLLPQYRHPFSFPLFFLPIQNADERVGGGVTMTDHKTSVSPEVTSQGQPCGRAPKARDTGDIVQLQNQPDC